MPDWLGAVQERLAADRLFAVATVISGPSGVGSKMLLDADGSCRGGLEPVSLSPAVIADAQAQMAREETTSRTYGEHEVFIEVFSPRPRLVVVGAVHTAIPLVRIARLLGYYTIVIDGRARFATPERFAEVDELIVEWPDEALAHLRVDGSTCVVILTHDPKFDLPTLRALAGRGARYVGAMGSRQTRRQHMDELRAEGVSSDFLDSVYGPVGLDLKARTPEEVALAIMAEITAVRYGGQGGHMKTA